MVTSQAQGAVQGAPLIWLRAEAVAVLFLAVLGFVHADMSWWWFVVLFPVPDLSMAGYLANPKLGQPYIMYIISCITTWDRQCWQVSVCSPVTLLYGGWR